MEEVILIVTIVASLFQIILFFKIWMLTNDVREIKNRELDLLKQAQLYSLKGDRKKAYELFYDSFLRVVIDAYNDSDSDYYYTGKYLKIRNRYSIISNKLGFNNVDFGRFDNRNKVASIFLTK